MKKLFIILIVLAFFFGAWQSVAVHAEETAAESASIEESVPLETQIEMWQEYIDKYIMPNAIAVITGISMVVAVFAKFKSIFALYKQDKDEFNSEKEVIFTDLSERVREIFQTLSDVKTTTLDSINNMPISEIKADIAKTKEALEAEMETIKDFTRMFEIFLSSERKMVETSQLSVADKKQMQKLFYEGEQLAKKKSESLCDVSDFVIAKIAQNEVEAETTDESISEIQEISKKTEQVIT